MNPHLSSPRSGLCLPRLENHGVDGGGFAVVIAIGMLSSHFKTGTADPLKSALLKQYKDKLAIKPTDEQLKQDIREMDLRLRQNYFRHVSFMNSGVWLLLGAVALVAVSARRLARYQKQLPQPQPNPEAAAQAVRAAALARWAVAASGIGSAPDSSF